MDAAAFYYNSVAERGKTNRYGLHKKCKALFKKGSKGVSGKRVFRERSSPFLKSRPVDAFRLSSCLPQTIGSRSFIPEKERKVVGGVFL